MLIDLDEISNAKLIYIPDGRYELERIPNPRGLDRCGPWLVLKGTKWGHNEEYWQNENYFKLEW